MSREGNSYQTHKAFISVSGEKSGCGCLFILDFAFFFFFFSLFLLTFSSRRFLKGQGHLAVFGSSARQGLAAHGTFGPGALALAEVLWHLKESGRSRGPALGPLGGGRSQCCQGCRAALKGISEPHSFALRAASPSPALSPPPHTSVSPTLERGDDPRACRGSRQCVGEDFGSTLAAMAELGPR